MLQAEEAAEKKDSEEQRVEESGGGVLWWLWDAFLGASPEVKKVESYCGKTFHPVFCLCPSVLVVIYFPPRSCLLPKVNYFKFKWEGFTTLDAVTISRTNYRKVFES